MNKSYPDTGFDDDHDTHAHLTLPRLSDEAVIEIHAFIHQLLNCFESSYGQQIDHLYAAINEDMKNDPLDLGDWSP